jgi:chromosome segregation ATPase
MLLSKALRMQQHFEDKKNEIIIEGLENRIKDFEVSLEKKDFLLQATEGSLVELQAENAKLNEELLKAQKNLKEKSEHFEQERKELQAKSEAEAAGIAERPSKYMLGFRHPLRASIKRNIQLSWG